MSEIRTKKPAAPELAQPTPAAVPPAPVRDENRGKGGAYEIRNGQRVLVQRTKAKE